MGGGAGHLLVLRGGSVYPGPTLSAGFDQAVLVITPLEGGWLVGGKGSGPAGGIGPALAFWSGGSATARDLTALVPPSFADGEIQGGAVAPAFGPRAVLLVGEGSYSISTGYGVGSLALLSWN